MGHGIAHDTGRAARRTGAADRAFMNHARQASEEEMRHLVDTLALAALFECPNIRIAEAEVAINHGSMGGYGQVYAISAAALIGWLKARLADPERAKDLARESPAAAALPERTAPTEEESIRTDKALLAAAYAAWKRTGAYDDMGNYLYKVAAKKLKLFSPSGERRKKYMEEGKKRAAAHFRAMAARRPMERAQMERCARDAEALAPGTEGLAMAHKEALQAALIGWFEDLKEAGMEMEDLF